MTFSRSLITAVAALVVLISASRLWGGIAPLPGAVGGPVVLPAAQPAPRRHDLRIDAFASSQTRFGSAEALRWQATKRALQRLSAEAVALRTELERARAEMAELRKSAAAWRKAPVPAPPVPAPPVVRAQTPKRISKPLSAPIEAIEAAVLAAGPRPDAASTRQGKSVSADQAARPAAATQKDSPADAPEPQDSSAPKLVADVRTAAAGPSAGRPAKPNSGRNQTLALRVGAGNLGPQERAVAPGRAGDSLVLSSQKRSAPLRRLAPPTPAVEATPAATSGAAPASVATTVTVAMSRAGPASLPQPAKSSSQKGQPKSAVVPPPVVLDPMELARQLQQALSRVGCDPGPVDGIWGRKSRQALTDFAKRTGVSLAGATPDPAVLSVVSKRSGRICPLICGSNSSNVNGRCVAIRSQPRQIAKPAALGRKAQGGQWSAPNQSAGQLAGTAAAPQESWIKDFWDEQ